MSAPRCHRAWEVEAARDGRVDGPALERFEEHLLGCEDCRAERAQLDRLGAELRALDGELPPDALALRRIKGRMLEAVDARLAGRRVQRRLGVGLAAGALCLVAGGLAWWLLRAPVDMRQEGPAQFSSTSDGNVERVELVDGRLRIAVRDPARHVRISVPDGVIEDLGTVFHVWVANGRTEEVDVEEGQVVLRLQGRPPQTVRAGEHWAAGPRTPVETPAPLAPAPVVAAPSPSPAPSASAIQRRSPAPPSARSEVPAPPVVAEVEESPAALEDAAYLAIIAHIRAGELEEARLAAKRYLREYPNGFRREEVGALLR
ncbi:MAG: FecR domain-containing protein [Myxococcota bacterium]